MPAATMQAQANYCAGDEAAKPKHGGLERRSAQLVFFALCCFMCF
jgi:hypothetical protein